jgi:Myb-like DNA-binding domain
MAKKRVKNSKKDNLCKKRRPWTPKEDAAIRGLVIEKGVKQWTLIAESLKKTYNITGRSGKQCRERWHNHLNTGILKKPWSLNEECTLFTTHKKIGNKWAEISKDIPGRTDNSIKNHFYSTIRKFYRKLKGKEGSPEDIRANIDQITDNVLDSLYSDRQNFINEEKLTSDSLDDIQILPDFSDMIVTGHHIKLPLDWYTLDTNFEDEQEILMYPMSPY